MGIKPGLPSSSYSPSQSFPIPSNSSRKPSRYVQPLLAAVQLVSSFPSFLKVRSHASPLMAVAQAPPTPRRSDTRLSPRRSPCSYAPWAPASRLRTPPPKAQRCRSASTPPRASRRSRRRRWSSSASRLRPSSLRGSGACRLLICITTTSRRALLAFDF